MKTRNIAFTGAIVVALVCSLALPAFAGIGININIGGAVQSAPAPSKGGPPPWAPAHGKRAKHSYKYYPDAQCYFDPVRATWFFLEASEWVVRATLPDRLRIGLGGPVILGMDVDRPYLHHKEVRGRHPGKGSGKHKGKSGGGKGKSGKGKGGKGKGKRK